ncbi:MAG: Ig-like domain-containing protein [Bacteroidota bacterium]
MKKKEYSQTDSFSHRKSLRCGLIALLLLTNVWLSAQVSIRTDRTTANYEIGQQMNFLVNGNQSGPATYTIYNDRFTMPLQTGNLNLVAGSDLSIPFQLDEAGIAICTVTQNGQVTKASAVFEADQLLPLEDEPTDFDAFWQAQKTALAAIPIDPQLSLYQTDTYSTTYRINLACIDNRRVYGYISIPSGSGPFPAVLSLPSFGGQANVAQPDLDIAQKGGAISMSISIHNAEPDQVDPNAYQPDVIDDREQLYVRYAVLAGIRAIDYLFSRSDFDGQSLAVTGVSQGGGLAIMLAGIDSRVQLLVQSNASHCQHPGLAYEMASGFPYYLDRSRTTVGTAAHLDATIQATAYYDAVHFAKRFDGQSLSVICYEDEVCPAATVFAAFNQLGGSKILLNARDLAHVHPDEYWAGRFDFFRRHFPAMRTPPWPWPDTDTGYLLETGDDQSISIAESADLDARLLFNNDVKSNVSAAWTKIDGPGVATFADPTALQTGVQFDQAGTYRLQLEVIDYDKLGAEGKFYTIIDQIQVEVLALQDNTPPEATLSTNSNPVSGPFLVQLQLSELATGLEVDDVQVQNATINDWSGTGLNYQFIATPLQAGEVQLQIPAGRFEDEAGNANNASNVLIVDYQLLDTTPPTALLYTNNRIVDGPFTVGLDLSEQAGGLVLADVVVTNGTASSWRGNGFRYEFLVTPDQEGPMSIQVPADAFRDAAGNANDASNLLLVEYLIEDRIPPTAVFSSPQTEVEGAFSVFLQLSELVNGLSTDDLVIDNANFIGWTITGLTYEIRLRTVAEGEISVSIPEASFEDFAGNPNPASNILKLIYQLPDVERPTATINSGATEVSGPFSARIEFSEAIANLQANDLSISNAQITQISGADDAYELQITPLFPGLISLSLAENKVTDLAGNGNFPSNVLEVEYKEVVTTVFALNATIDKRVARLDWVSNTTFSAETFSVEHSTDGSQFESIHDISVTDSLANLLSFVYLDAALSNGDNYYRILQINQDSSQQYSNVEKITAGDDLDEFLIYPNPTVEQVFIHGRTYSGRQASIELRDVRGRLLSDYSYDAMPQAPISLALPKLSPGVYTLSFSIKGFSRFSKKLVIAEN